VCKLCICHPNKSSAAKEVSAEEDFFRKMALSELKDKGSEMFERFDTPH
jgi:hypothetical protein